MPSLNALTLSLVLPCTLLYSSKLGLGTVWLICE